MAIYAHNCPIMKDIKFGVRVINILDVHLKKVLRNRSSKKPQFLLRFMFSTCLVLPHFAYAVKKLTIFRRNIKSVNCGKSAQ